MARSETPDRPPQLEETSLSEQQRAVYETIASGPRGVVEGPLRVWLQSPELAERAQALGAFCRYGTRLPTRLSELAILVSGAFWRSGFEWAVHAPIAIAAGLDPTIVEAIRDRAVPQFSDEREATIHAFATELHRDHLVSRETYERAIRHFGTAATVELVGLLGYYTLISMTINAFEVPLPDGASDPFPTD